MGSAAALGVLVVSGWCAGLLAQRLRLPRITGALFAGMVLGPGVGLVHAAELRGLSFVAATTLAFIALLAGARLTPAVVKETARSAAWSTCAQLLLCAPALAWVFARVAPPPLAALAVLWGVVATTRSPIITIAVLTERRADGPLARHLLAVVVLQSAVSLPLFFAALVLARTAEGGGAVSAVDVVKLTGSVAFIALGFVLANRMPNATAAVRLGERAAPVLLTLFFSMAGASVDLNALQQLWPLALGLSLLRAALTFAACRVGHVLARDAPVIGNNAWLALLPQAGVTVGLATLAATALPTAGAAFASLAIAVVTVDEVVGAPLLRFALTRAGEGR